MERQVRLEEISDGKLYGLNDMVRADCGDCEGCSACCHGMGSSIVLDPLDIHRLSRVTGQTFEEMIEDKIQLNVADGLILPNLKMNNEEDSCVFLNREGRCSIHADRPGICRLFPLGRYYENHSFQYFLQIHECKKENRSKVKVKKWIDAPDLKQNQQFIASWHYFLKDVQTLLENSGQVEFRRSAVLYILNLFYCTAYDREQDFYGQFQVRLEKGRTELLKLNQQFVGSQSN